MRAGVGRGQVSGGEGLGGGGRSGHTSSVRVVVVLKYGSSTGFQPKVEC